MIIAVTGTPGTGKTEVAREVAEKLGYRYVSLNDLAEEKGLIEGMDEERGAHIIDEEELEELDMDNDTVLDGHLAHYVPADVCVVLRTEPDVLEERLRERDWDEEKVRENVDAEYMGICSMEAREEREKVLDIDTTGTEASEVAETVAELVREGRPYNDPIDWMIED